MPAAPLRNVFMDELKDLYDAEHQLTQALPKMAKAASSQDLKSAFQEHLEVTKQQIGRLEQVFQRLGEQPHRKHCKGMEGLVKEAEEGIKKIEEPDVCDAYLIGAAQKAEHYEIAGYGTVRTWAAQMGDQECCRLLQETLDEEGEADKKLTQLAERHINREATQGHRKAA
jgi:ferritin-like metal-binding protein YciE